MNDFQRDITGLTVVLKPRNYYKKPSTVSQRTLVVVSGSGCNPEMVYGRKTVCRLPNGSTETISSYDLEYVIDENGKKIFHYEPVFTGVDMCPTALTKMPEIVKLVKRKR